MPRATATRGSILVWAGRATEALPWLEGALRFDHADARTSLFLGMAYYFLDRYGDAAEALTAPSPATSDATPS